MEEEKEYSCNCDGSCPQCREYYRKKKRIDYDDDEFPNDSVSRAFHERGTSLYYP